MCKGTRLHAVCALFLLLAVQGCATMAYKTAVDERGLETLYKDEKATAALKAAIFNDETVGYLEQSVAVYRGHAYIVGEYERAAQKRRLQELAVNTEGVRWVSVYLLPDTPESEGACETEDSLELKARVKKSLVLDEDVWATNVDVLVVQCHVVLVGLVGSDAERRKAVAHARDVRGARRVESYLQVAED
jgi:hyperosmotically inducible protein